MPTCKPITGKRQQQAEQATGLLRFVQWLSLATVLLCLLVVGSMSWSLTRSLSRAISGLQQRHYRHCRITGLHPSRTAGQSGRTGCHRQPSTA
jgi:hypothetical protein